MTRLTRSTCSTRLPARWLLAIALSLSFATQADESADLRRMYDAGHASAAMSRVDELLTTHPNDPQIRFLKGVMLADAKRSVEALALFQKLTEDFPELAEPFNNLAALHAASGDYRKARDALEQSLLINPSYVTAHENLGDVSVALARQSYARALQLAPNNVTVSRKLALLRELSVLTHRVGNSVSGASDRALQPVVTDRPR